MVLRWLTFASSLALPPTGPWLAGHRACRAGLL